MDTTIFSQLNWLHILVAALAYFFLGALWYGPLFSKKWIAYHNINTENADKKGLGLIMIGSFVWMFIATTALAILIERLNLQAISSGVKLGLFTGVCYSAATLSITYLYLKRPIGLHFIDGLYHIIGQVVAGAILCAWK